MARAPSRHILLDLTAELRDVAREGWFRAGLALRAGLIALCLPIAQERWFLPFLGQFLRSSDPYGSFLRAGGDPLAWPYGPAMTLAHLPTLLLGALGANIKLLSLSFGACLVLADLGILLALRRLVPRTARTLASKLWWLSPAALVISYWHGQTDVVPLFFLMAGLALFHAGAWRWAGALLGLSISAKLTMAFAAPFIVAWLWASRRHRAKLFGVCATTTLVVLANYALLFSSAGAREMLRKSPVLSQLEGTALNLHGTPIMLLPMILLGLLYASARSRRLGFSLMVGILGAAAFACAAVLAVAPGWWLWALPFLGLYAVKHQRERVLPAVWIFGALLALHTVLTASGAAVWGQPLPLVLVPAILRSLALTAVFSLGLLLAASMFKHAFADNDPYRLASGPIVIGIAGASGAGKDTLSNALARVFGRREVVAVSGDDYHKWERGSHMWRSWTHLHPDANHLREFTDDVRALAQGRSIRCRYYDHRTGRFEPRRSKQGNDVVLVSGLHALLGPELRDVLDVKIYLDMDADLMRHFKLSRDTTQRDQAMADIVKSMERRVPDLKKYVEPQATHADLVFRLEPRDADAMENAQTGRDIPMRLRARVRNGVGLERLCRFLTVTCFSHAEVERFDSSGESQFVFEGDDVQCEDIAELVPLLIPHHAELLAEEPAFSDGVTGIMQLLVLLEISALRGRKARSLNA
jgi:uridine kinase